MNAKFLPLLIGSLPLSAVEKAIEAVFSTSPVSPSWPQLPKVSHLESMNFQYLEGIPGWQIANDRVVFKKSDEIIEEFSVVLEKALHNDTTAFPITSQYSVCFEPFFKELNKRRDVEIVKGQVIGPITFLTSHIIDNYGMIIKDEGYNELIPRILGLKAQFQIERFKKAKPQCKPIVFFDEPILSQIGSAVTNINTDDIKEIITKSLNVVEGYKGIHICGNSDWDFILSLPIDIVNFDAFNYGSNFLLYKESIKTFIERGGYIAAGLIPTDSKDIEEIDNKKMKEKTTTFLNELTYIIGNDMVSKRVFLTPSCGMGALTEAQAEKALKLLKDTSISIQQQFQLTL